jgi:hypothetical protein
MLLVLLIVIITPVCFSQQTSNYYFPDYYSSTGLDHIPLVNPAWSDEDSRATFGSLYKSRTGILNEVASLTAYADVSLSRNKSFGQIARVLFHNEQEGPFISSPGFYGNYAVRVPLKEDISVSMGLAAGVASLSFTAASGSGRASVADGNAGMVFRFKKSEVGAASYQIFNSSMVAISSRLVFRRFWQFYAQSQRDINENFTIRGHLFWRPQPLKDYANASAILSYRETVSMGAMYQLFRGTSFLTSFRLAKNSNPVIVNLTYNSLLFSPLNVPVSSFEVGLRYLVMGGR